MDLPQQVHPSHDTCGVLQRSDRLLEHLLRGLEVALREQRRALVGERTRLHQEGGLEHGLLPTGKACGDDVGGHDLVPAGHEAVLDRARPGSGGRDTLVGADDRDLRCRRERGQQRGRDPEQPHDRLRPGLERLHARGAPTAAHGAFGAMTGTVPVPGRSIRT